MPKVDINPADYDLFAARAAAAGLTVDQWLTAAGLTTAGRESSAPASLDDLWATSLGDLDGQIASTQQRSYLRLARLNAIVEGVALLVVPDAFTRDVIESRLRATLTEALSRRLGTPIQIAVKLDEPRPTPAPPPAAPPPTPDLQRLTELLARPEVARQIAEVLTAAG